MNMEGIDEDFKVEVTFGLSPKGQLELWIKISKEPRSQKQFSKKMRNDSGRGIEESTQGTWYAFKF